MDGDIKAKKVCISGKFILARNSAPIDNLPHPDYSAVGDLTEEEGELFIDGHSWNLMMHSFTCELNLQRQGLNLEGGRLYAN